MLLLDQCTNLPLHPQIWTFYQAHMTIHQSTPTKYYCQTATVEQMCGHPSRYAQPYTYRQIADMLPSLDDVDLATLELRSTNPVKHFLDNMKTFQCTPDQQQTHPK